MRLKEYFNEQHNLFWEFFSVPDRLEDGDKIIFVLESGHTDEVTNKKPLSGEAGIKFSQLLLDNQTAVGRLDKHEFLKMGFLESSPIPLDIKTYNSFIKNSSSPIREYDSNAVSKFTIIKKKYKEYSDKGLRDDFKDWLGEYLTDSKLYVDYKERMNQLWDQGKYFIICGIIAQGFFEKFINSNGKDGFLKYYKGEDNLMFCECGKNKVIYFEHPSTWKEKGSRERKFRFLIEHIDL
jgi:hypothetical protein